MNHPYINYAKALLMLGCDTSLESDISPESLLSAVKEVKSYFSLKPASDFEGCKKVKFKYTTEKNLASENIFLAPNVVSTEKSSKGILDAVDKFIKEAANKDEKWWNKRNDVTMAIAPTSGDFLSFTETIGRKKAKLSNLDIGYSILMSLTPEKPCLQVAKSVKEEGKDKIIRENVCIVPDLGVVLLKNFIRLFKQMKNTGTDNLLVGRVLHDAKGYKPSRPLIFKGNFPNPPYSSSLGTIALLAAIGEFAKFAEYSKLAKDVLESLKTRNIYLFQYGSASMFSYNHYIIDLAKESKLKRIVDSISKTVLYKEGKRTLKNIEYQKFDLFTGRFLQLFDSHSFRDFFAFRAEYPSEMEILLTTYFIKMENIDNSIVSSARELGKWLNFVAFKAAKKEVSREDDKEKLRTIKAKVLVELESSIFSAKTGDALIAQTITRAGRLSGYDAPDESSLFMEKTISGELPLDKAKNLLMAFSRLKSKADSSFQFDEDIENAEDYSEL